MGIDTVGKAIVTAKVETLEDLYKVHQGALSPDQARSVTVNNAHVDTGATGLMLPGRLIAQLGRRPTRTRQARTADGLVTIQLFEAVRLTIQGRECTVDVHQVPDDPPVLIGQIPLEALDGVVDPVNQRLIGNPDHGGQQMIDVF
jgi:clan AA aspartic protease